jgi:hypothetical protein
MNSNDTLARLMSQYADGELSRSELYNEIAEMISLEGHGEEELLSALGSLSLGFVEAINIAWSCHSLGERMVAYSGSGDQIDYSRFTPHYVKVANRLGELGLIEMYVDDFSDHRWRISQRRTPA